MFDIAGFYEARSVDDAVRALSEDENAELINGGTDVLIRVRAGKDAGRALVSVKNIPEIKGVKLLPDESIWIGAGTSFTHITNDPLIMEHLPMLGEAVDMVGGPQIRNMGTMGGNICNGATSADSAASAVSLNTELLLTGPEGERRVSIHDFYTGPGRTVRRREEVCTGFLIRKEDYEGWTGKYIKYGKRRAMEIATLGCAVRVKLNGDRSRIEEARLAYGVAAPTPIRCREAEDKLKNRSLSDPGLLSDFSETALTEVNPRSSWRASREFRMQLISELAKRALSEAVKLSGGEIHA